MNYEILMERYLLVRYNAAAQVIIFSNVAKLRNTSKPA